MFCLSPLFSEKWPDYRQVQVLALQSQRLDRNIGKLLEDIGEARFEELEAARQGIQDRLARWMEGEGEMDGQSVQRVLKESYRVAAAYGLDVEHLKRLHAMARGAILRADFVSPGKTGIGTLQEFTKPLKDVSVVGDALAALGLADNAEERMAESMRKRVVQYRTLMQVYIKALTLRDPGEALAHMQNYANLTVQFVTGQERQAIDADIKMMLANQNAVVEYVGVFPLVGEAMALVAAYTGEDLAGNKLTSLERVFSVVLSAGPEVVEQALKRYPVVGEKLGALALRLQSITVEARKTLSAPLAKALGRADPMGDFMKKMNVHLPAKTKRASKVELARIDDAHKQLKEYGPTRERETFFKLGREEGRKKVDALQGSFRGGDGKKALDAMLAVQGDKHAMQVLKGSEESLIKKFNRRMDAVYETVDMETKNHLFDIYKKDLARAEGWDPDALTVAQRDTLKKKIDLKPVSNPVDPKQKVKPSFDRDVTAKIKVNGRELDVPAEVLETAYGPAYWRTTKGTPPPKNKSPKKLDGAVKAHLEEMDQVAMDALQAEAYSGPKDLAVAMDSKAALVFSRAETVGDTFVFKANHPFQEAEKIIKGKKTTPLQLAKAEGLMEEGMRNLSKQYDKQIHNRVQAFNAVLSKKHQPLLSIPPDLRQAQAVLKTVGHGETPASAMKKLATMGLTSQSLAERMGDFVKKIHKTAQDRLNLTPDSDDILLRAYPSHWGKGRAVWKYPGQKGGKP